MSDDEKKWGAEDALQVMETAVEAIEMGHVDAALMLLKTIIAIRRAKVKVP